MNAKKEVVRQRQLKALKSAIGAWQDKDHPELKQGVDKWVSKLRRQDEARFSKMTGTGRR